MERIQFGGPVHDSLFYSHGTSRQEDTGQCSAAPLPGTWPSWKAHSGAFTILQASEELQALNPMSPPYTSQLCLDGDTETLLVYTHRTGPCPNRTQHAHVALRIAKCSCLGDEGTRFLGPKWIQTWRDRTSDPGVQSEREDRGQELSNCTPQPSLCVMEPTQALADGLLGHSIA